MKFFLDSANLGEVREAAALGVIDGVTTNPSLIAREKGDIMEVVREIASVVSGPVSAEVLGASFAEMTAEARELAKLAPNIVVKVPITAEGLKTVRQLAGEGIRTNVTLIFSANQALLAARAGAAFVSPFVGRLDDIGQDGIALVKDIADIYAIHGIETEIIAASIRNTIHITQAARAGAHIATVPFKVLRGALAHPLTEAGIERFLEDWRNANR